MPNFKEFEMHVLRLLTAPVLSFTQLDDFERQNKLVSYEYTGCGYFVTATHPSLPIERMVCHEPFVSGEAEGIVCGFVVFIENKELMLECHSMGENEVPEDFRSKTVCVKTS